MKFTVINFQLLLSFFILIIPIWGQSREDTPETFKPVILQISEEYQNLIPRLENQPPYLYENLLYEGNNLIMREKNNLSEQNLTGSTIANKWRGLVVHTKGTFVLRDALYSQQDHPYRISSVALMLPGNWLTAAAVHSSQIPEIYAPDLHNDTAWVSINNSEEIFGIFPPSETLFKVATNRHTVSADSVLVYNARKSIRILAGIVRQLIESKKEGLNNMLQKGSEIIARSDLQYFGNNIRKNHIIPIMVENPTDHEIKEGKGLSIFGRDDISDEIITKVRRALYARRLDEGAIAIERYDLSIPSERIRALKILEELIPKGSKGATVWLWVTGKLRTDRKMEGDDATKYIESFRNEVNASNIEESRLNYVCKPSVIIPYDSSSKSVLDKKVELFRKLQIPLSINMYSAGLKKILDNK